MAHDFLKTTRHSAYKLLYFQLALVVLAALIFLFYQGFVSMWSVLLGGVAWMVPCFYFVRKCFIMRQSCTPQQLVKKFYLAELIKLVFSGLLVVLFVKFIPINVLPFLCGYGVAVLTIWLMPYVYRSDR